MMDKKKFSLILTIVCLLGALWVRKEHAIGYVNAAIFLIAGFVSFIAYFKASRV